MKQNVGGVDRAGRIVVGLLAMVGGLASVSGYWEVWPSVGALALVIGAVLLVTGTTATCPLNEAADIDTTG